jgi:hypothetical protein
MIKMNNAKLRNNHPPPDNQIKDMLNQNKKLLYRLVRTALLYSDRVITRALIIKFLTWQQIDPAVYNHTNRQMKILDCRFLIFLIFGCAYNLQTDWISSGRLDVDNRGLI